MKSYRMRRLAFAGVWICLLVILVASLRPVAVDLVDVPNSDKIGHVLAYGSLVFCWLLAGNVRFGRALFIMIACCLLGAVIELVQPYVGRHASWADAFANLGGVVLGILAALIAQRRAEKTA